MMLICVHSSCSYGQQNNLKNFKNSTPQQRADYQTSLMKKKLKLDAGQITKVQAINLKYAEKFQPLIKSTDDRASKIKQFLTLQKQKDNELQAVFTKDQYEQYKAFEQEIRSKMRDRFKK